MGQPDPQQAVRLSEPHPPRSRPVQHVKLVPQRQHLQLQDDARACATSQGQQDREDDGHDGREGYAVIAFKINGINRHGLFSRDRLGGPTSALARAACAESLPIVLSSGRTYPSRTAARLLRAAPLVVVNACFRRGGPGRHNRRGVQADIRRPLTVRPIRTSSSGSKGGSGGKHCLSGFGEGQDLNPVGECHGFFPVPGHGATMAATTRSGPSSDSLAHGAADPARAPRCRGPNPRVDCSACGRRCPG